VPHQRFSVGLSQRRSSEGLAISGDVRINDPRFPGEGSDTRVVHTPDLIQGDVASVVTVAVEELCIFLPWAKGKPTTTDAARPKTPPTTTTAHHAHDETRPIWRT